MTLATERDFPLASRYTGGGKTQQVQLHIAHQAVPPFASLSPFHHKFLLILLIFLIAQGVKKKLVMKYAKEEVRT
jgi:hypothetical protein